MDGFHPVNVGKLAIGDPSGFVPCTPLGCQRLLLETGIDTAGRATWSCSGRSLLVGKPFALLMMGKGKGGDATVTVAHSRSQGSARPSCGRRIFWWWPSVKRELRHGGRRARGAVVIDVGINQVDDPAAKRGYRLVGDVDFAGVAPKCAAITPVPGGVGPMTIAMLMSNTDQGVPRLQSSFLHPSVQQPSLKSKGPVSRTKVQKKLECGAFPVLCRKMAQCCG